MFVSKDLHGVDLEEFKYGGTNITAFRLVDPEGPEIRRIVRDWNLNDRNRKIDQTSVNKVIIFQLENKMF